ncbi:MAG: hypothetical protein V2A73_14495 [Pseudomonadota bacterium]
MSCRPVHKPVKEGEQRQKREKEKGAGGKPAGKATDSVVASIEDKLVGMLGILEHDDEEEKDDEKGENRSIVDELAGEIRAQPHGLGRRLREQCDDAVLLVVDQLEEVFTLASAAERAAFLAALGSLGVLDPGLRTVFSLRQDFLERLREAGRLGEELLSAAVALAPARPVVSLPLLSFVLAELWGDHDRERKVIPVEALEELGGVGGSTRQSVARANCRSGRVPAWASATSSSSRPR